MEEVEDEVKDHFAEHQLKIELVQIMQDELNDLSGASKPVEVKLFGPDHNELRRLAEEVGEAWRRRARAGASRRSTAMFAKGNPDLMIQVDGARAAKLGLTAEAVERQLPAMFLGRWPPRCGSRPCASPTCASATPIGFALAAASSTPTGFSASGFSCPTRHRLPRRGCG